MGSILAKLFRSTCLYTSNEAKEFFKVFFVASSSLNELLEDKQYAKLGGVDTSQTYLLFQTLLLLFLPHSSMIRTKLTWTDVVFSRASCMVFLCAGLWNFRCLRKFQEKSQKIHAPGWTLS